MTLISLYVDQAVGDLVEAVLGALMVDGGFSAVEPSRYFFDTVFKPFLEKFMSGMHSLPERLSFSSLSSAFSRQYILTQVSWAEPAKILIQLVGARVSLAST